jgi:hypothetical protein
MNFHDIQEARKSWNEKWRNHHLVFFKDNIIKNKNFSFTKYGDGELTCMLGIEGHNCDGHPYSKDLGSLLKVSLLKNADRKNVYIGDWTGWRGDTLSQYRDQLLEGKNPNYILYEILMNHEENPNPNLYNLIDQIKNSKRKKIFIGPNKLHKVNDLINATIQIEVPPNNTFSEYPEIKKKCLHLMEESCIFIFSCGMPSKVLIDDILSGENKVTCLDFGSGFDNIILDKETRQGQIDYNIMKNFYKKLLT